MRLNPHHPERFFSHLGKAYFAARRYGEAIEAFMHLSSLDAGQQAFVAAACALMGDRTAAAAHAARIARIDPAFTPAAFKATLHYARQSDFDHVLDGLAKAQAAAA
jgi:adenylate cyclase